LSAFLAPSGQGEATAALGAAEAASGPSDDFALAAEATASAGVEARGRVVAVEEAEGAGSGRETRLDSGASLDGFPQASRRSPARRAIGVIFMVRGP
jgi:hypothetical protein